MMDHFNVAVVVHGQTPVSDDLGGLDPYAEPKQQGKFVTVDSGRNISWKLCPYFFMSLCCFDLTAAFDDIILLF